MNKITIDRAVLEQALEVLTDNRDDVKRCESEAYMTQYYDKATTSLREALEQPQQEPKFLYDEGEGLLHDPFDDAPTECIPLYTSPPARKQLTDEDMDALVFDCGLSATARDIARAIEAAHGIKDTP